MTSYPGPTKTLSTNYTVTGTQFAFADEDADALEPEDIWRQGRAVEEHTHDGQRGLPVRRVDTASTPAALGQVQILSDDFRWWAAAAGAVRTAVSREGNQALDGTWRFNAPVVLAAQLSTPAAPGASLSSVYVKPDGRMYIRSGTGPEQGVGAPPTWNLPAKAWETDQVPGSSPELARLSGTVAPDWVLAFDAASNEIATIAVRVPSVYVPTTPLPLAVAWQAPGGADGQTLTFRFGFARRGPGQASPSAWGITTDLVATHAGAAGGYQVTTGTVTVPSLAPGDRLYVGLQRLGNTGNVPGDAQVFDGSVAFA